MAYISVITNRDAISGNAMCVNGSDPVRIFCTAIHKVKDDFYKVTIHSSNGSAWECEGDLNTRRACSACLSIRLNVDANGNIVDMEYAVFYLNTQQEGAYALSGRKLKLEYTQKQREAASSFREEHVDYDEELVELMEGEEEEPKVTPVYDQDEEPVQSYTPKKRVRVGWIIFGVLCILAALKNMDQMSVLASCGVVGLISLLIGFKKK